MLLDKNRYDNCFTIKKGGGWVVTNPVIAKLFRNVKLAENAGYGFDKMLKWEKETNQKVVFDNSLAFSIVTFNYPSTKDGGAIGGAIGGAMENSFKNRQIEILNIIKNNPSVSYRSISKQLNINESAVLKHLSNLKKKGFIEREGKTRGYWIINKVLE